MSKANKISFQQIYDLQKLAKTGKKAEFIKSFKEQKIGVYLKDLDGTQLSMMIYSFNTLNMKTQIDWKQIELMFMRKYKQMNIQDLCQCVHNLCKHTNNQSVWDALNDIVLQNIVKIKQSQYEYQNIGMFMYGFATNQNGSSELWSEFEMIVVEQLHRMDERTLSMVLWSISRVKKTNELLLEKIEDQLLQDFGSYKQRNQSTIIYSFAKLNYTSEKLWLMFENTAIASITTSKQLFARDLAELIWSFSKVNRRSKELWDILGNQILANINKFSMFDLSQTALSLLLFDNSETKIWQAMRDQFIQNIQVSTDHVKRFNDFLVFSHAVWYLNMNNQTFNEKCILNEKVILNSVLKENYHISIYSMDPTLWSSQAEDIYIKKIQHLIQMIDQNPRKFLKQFIDMVYLVQRTPASQKMYNYLYDIAVSHIPSLIPQMDDKNDVAGAAYVIYVLTKHQISQNQQKASHKFIDISVQLFKYFKIEKSINIVTRGVKEFAVPGDPKQNEFWKMISQYSDDENWTFLLISCFLSREGLKISDQNFDKFFVILKNHEKQQKHQNIIDQLVLKIIDQINPPQKDINMAASVLSSILELDLNILIPFIQKQKNQDSDDIKLDKSITYDINYNDAAHDD